MGKLADLVVVILYMIMACYVFLNCPLNCLPLGLVVLSKDWQGCVFSCARHWLFKVYQAYDLFHAVISAVINGG